MTDDEARQMERGMYEADGIIVILRQHYDTTPSSGLKARLELHINELLFFVEQCRNILDRRNGNREFN